MEIDVLTVAIVLGTGALIAAGVWILESRRRRRQAARGERPDP